MEINLQLIRRRALTGADYRDAGAASHARESERRHDTAHR
jgi:hypothetical protein